MSAATAPRNTDQRPGTEFNVPVAAATTIWLGTQVALDTDGNLVPASDAAGLRVLGRAEETVDNSAGLAGALTGQVRRGVFLWDNSGDEAIVAADKGKFAFVEDDQTVAATSTHLVKAGRIIDVVDAGVWVDSNDAHDVPSADTITGAADLAALKVALLAIFQAQGLVK